MRPALFTLTLWTLTACGGSSSSDFALPVVDESSSTSTAEANVGPAGGTLSTPEASLQIPPGAVSQNTVFSLSRRDGANLAFGSTLQASSVFTLEPDGATFDTPVLVTIPYDPAAIVTPDTPNDLIALLQDTRTGQIERLTPTSVDTSAQTATYEVPHFSQLQNALPARVLPQFSTLSANPDTGLAPNRTTTLTLSVRNKILQEFGGVEFTLTASGSNNTFGATTLTTDANGRAQTTFTTSDDGTKTITASFNGTTIQTLDLVFGLPPVTVADTGSTDEDSVLMGTSLLANDSDPDMDALTAVAESVTSTMGGSVVIAADGTYSYTPPASFQALPQGGSAMDTFTYQASDGTLTTPGTATISVSGLNDAPTSLADARTTDEDTALTGPTLLGNDTDPDTGDTLTAVAETVTSTQGLSVTIASDGTFSYDPSTAMTFQALGASGMLADTFTYQATDSTATVSAQVTVTVTGVNDPPTAADAMATTVTDAPVVITLTGADVEGSSLTFAVASGPSNGSLGSISQPTPNSASVTYTPSMGFNGSDSFTFTTNDGAITSNAATASITVDVPVVVTGLARFEDVNQNKVADSGDTLIVPFDMNVSGGALSDFALSVTDDRFGAGATVADGPAANEQTITLGADAVLKIRQDFDLMDTDAGSSSGLDAAALSTRLQAGTPVDLTPGLGSSTAFGTGSDVSRSGAVADMDADGDLDLILANEFGQNVVYLNDGAGTFPSATNFGTGSERTFSVAAADVDADGDLDLITGNYGSQNVVYLNDGAGVFSSSVNFGSSSRQTFSVAVADMDADGDLDIVTGNDFGQNVVYLNDGTGTFPSATNFGTGSERTFSVAAADIDADGDLDIITGNFGNQDVIYLNDGAGAFSSSIDFGSRQTPTYCVTAADIDADGDLDIVTAIRMQTNVIHLNDGAGSFSPSIIFGPSSGQTSSVAVADMDADGDLDIVTGDDFGQNAVYLNDGTGTFPSATNFGTGSERTFSVISADTDADGDLDIVTPNSGGQNVIYLNSLLRQTPDLTASTNFGSGSDATFSVQAADMDGDGDLDLVTGNFGGQNVVYLQDAMGAFSSSINFGTGTDSTRSVAVADVDQDGDLDLVAGNDAGEQNVVYLQDAMGAFSSSVNFGTGTDSPQSITVADVDGDGDLDLVTGNFGEQNVVYLQDAMGAFSSSVNFGTGTDNTRSVAVADVDADGDLDVVTGNDAGEQNVVYLQDAMGAFSSSVNFGTGSERTFSVAVADVDQDGNLDLITANRFEQNVVYLQDAMGAFSSSVDFGTGTDGTVSVQAADMDGDGDLDLVTGDDAGGDNAVFLQDPMGAFSSSVNFGTSADDTQSIAVADVDGDGDLDLVTGNRLQQNVVYLND